MVRGDEHPQPPARRDAAGDGRAPGVRRPLLAIRPRPHGEFRRGPARRGPQGQRGVGRIHVGRNGRRSLSHRAAAGEPRRAGELDAVPRADGRADRRSAQLHVRPGAGSRPGPAGPAAAAEVDVRGVAGAVGGFAAVRPVTPCAGVLGAGLRDADGQPDPRRPSAALALRRRRGVARGDVLAAPRRRGLRHGRAGRRAYGDRAPGGRALPRPAVRALRLPPAGRRVRRAGARELHHPGGAQRGARRRPRGLPPLRRARVLPRLEPRPPAPRRVGRPHAPAARAHARAVVERGRDDVLRRPSSCAAPAW